MHNKIMIHAKIGKAIDLHKKEHIKMRNDQRNISDLRPITIIKALFFLHPDQP